MAKAEIFSGICGFTTYIVTKLDNEQVKISVQSDCKAINHLGENLTQVEPFNEISFRRGMPETIQAGIKFCTHACCPVPVGIIKAIEIEAGLALPKDVTIKLSKE
jgi:hypothetical protein